MSLTEKNAKNNKSNEFSIPEIKVSPYKGIATMFHILCSKYQSLVEGDSDDDGFREKTLFRIAHTYMVIGTLYDDTEDYEDSMICYNQGLEV